MWMSPEEQSRRACGCVSASLLEDVLEGQLQTRALSVQTRSGFPEIHLQTPAQQTQFHRSVRGSAVEPKEAPPPT